MAVKDLLILKNLDRLFLLVLALKLIFSSILGSDFLTKLFIPFVNYFVVSGFDNPYQHFFEIGVVKAFPYSGAMLFILTIPRLLLSPAFSLDWAQASLVGLFTLRLPILIADLLIYLVLRSWLATKEKLVTFFYWCSPLLFYINYYHGQLDAIPVSLLFLSLWVLFKKHYNMSFVFLGLAISAKMSILAALPFIAVFIFRTTKKLTYIINLIFIVVFTYLVLAFPFFSSEGFRQLVLGSEEQGRVFLLTFPFNYMNLSINILPAIYLLILLRFSIHYWVNRDLLLMYLGLAFILLVSMLPPMPGWFYWSVPILTYFFAKFPQSPRMSFWLLNISFLIYFSLIATSDIFQAWQLTFPGVGNLPTPFYFLKSIGVDSGHLVNLSFTLLEVALLMSAYWIYKIAIKSHLESRLARPMFIGVGGDSGSGKTTVTNTIANLLGQENYTRLAGDDLHKWERGDKNWNLFTHLNPLSNKLNIDVEHALALKSGSTINRISYNHRTGKFDNPSKIDPKPFVLFEGLHTFFLVRMRGLCDIKIFVDPSEKLRIFWKLRRDMIERGYSQNKVMQQIHSRTKDKNKFISPQKTYADVVVSYSFTKGFKGEINKEPKLKLTLRFENSIHIDTLKEVLTSIRGVVVNHDYDSSLNYQILQFDGNPKSSTIEKIAYDVIPNLEEYLGTRPRWENGFGGIIQLVVLYFITEKMRYRDISGREL